MNRDCGQSDSQGITDFLSWFRLFMSRDTIISRSEWAFIGATGIADLVLSHFTGVPITVSWHVLAALAIIVAAWPVTLFVTQKTGFAKGSEVLAENAAKFFIFIFFVSAFEYFIASSSAPLYDERLIAIDAALGFHWPDFFSWINDHRLIRKILAYCYVSLQIQAVLVLFLVGAIYPRRAHYFVTAFLISSCLTMLFFGLFPVAGPFVTYHHTDLPQAYYTEHYLQLRAHAMTVISLDDIRGIVSFPSFHVASAVIITYFFRRMSFLTVLIALLNIGMGIAALVIGGHYLSDILAGIIVGIVTIAAIERLQGQGQERPLSWKK